MRSVSGGRVGARWSALLATLALGALLACKGGTRSSSAGAEEPASALASSRAAYVGQWSGPDVSLSISPEGEVHYKRERKSGGTSTNKTITGSIKAFQGAHLKVAALITVTLEVQAPPHEVDGVWKMTAEGDELTRLSSNVGRAAEIEGAIKDNLDKNVGATRSVTCPREASTATAFKCQALFEDGQRVSYAVKVDAANIQWEAEAVPLSGPQLEQSIVELFAKQRKETVTATCPAKTIFRQVGEVFTCEARKAGQAGAEPMLVSITVKDTTGNVGIDYQPPKAKAGAAPSR